MNVWHEMVKIILDPWVTVGLLAIGMAFLIAELMKPNAWGVNGNIAVLFLGLVFAAYITSGTATWVGMVLFLIGLVFMLVETHVFPGHGLSAFAGLICIFVGLYWALGGAKTNALFTTAVAGFGTVLAVIAFLVYLPRSKVWRMLGHEMKHNVGSSAYLGKSGVAVTPLKPAGIGEIGGKRLDVLTESGYIPNGTPIEVVRVEGGRVVVREIEESV